MQTRVCFYGRPNFLRWMGLCGFILLLAGSLADVQAQQTRYVKTNGSGDGTANWANASNDLQAVINASSSGDQIWVAAGTYKPTTGTDRTIAYAMKEGVAIYGGFKGTETQFSDRPTINLTTPSSTTLSGDIGQAGNSDDNSYHIIYNNNNGLSAAAVLDGFVMKGGKTEENIFSASGTALHNFYSSPTIRNCTFTNNQAASTDGGAVLNSSSNSTFTNCNFVGNMAVRGGALAINFGNITLTNCSFSHNSASQSGAALEVIIGGTLTVINCSFSGNSATNTAGVLYNESTAIFKNCILWGNSPNDLYAPSYNSPTTTVTNSIIAQSGYAGQNGNSSQDPLFVDATNDNLRLLPCSPALNVGDNAANTTPKDLDDNTRIYGSTIDLGAFEVQRQPIIPTVITTQPATSSAVCAGSNLIVSVVASGPNLVYTWKKNGQVIGTNSPNLQLSNVSAADASTYTVDVTGDCNTVTSRVFTLAVNTNPESSLSKNGDISCSNPLVTLTAPASNGATYHFSNGATQISSGNTATVSEAGTYSVVVTNPSGCTASASIEVTSDKTAPSSVSLTASGAISCTNPTVTLTASPATGVTYAFSTGTTPGTSENTAAVSQAGTYSVVVTSPNGCTAVASVEVTGNKTPPTAGITPTATALNCTLPSATLTAKGGGTYQWSTGANTTEITVSEAGTYSVVVTNPSGCTASASIEVTSDKTAPSSVSLTASGAISCTNPTVTLTASPATGVTYAFSTGTTPGTSENTAAVSQAGTYSVVVTSPNGCTAVANVEVTGNKTPPAAPTLALTAGTTLPILQNTPAVSLTISGCASGLLTWSGSNQTQGTSSEISIPTSATGTLIYSATCTSGVCTSAPGQLSVVIEASLVSGSFDGFINGADCSSFRGWAWDRNKGNTAVSVDILDGSRVIQTLLADQFRQDLADAGKGNGKHGFRFTIPDQLKDGNPHLLSARVAGSNFILKDSPKALICQGNPTPSANKPPQPPTPTVLIAPLVAQVGVPFSGTLVAFTDPENGSLTYTLTNLPDGLSLNSATRVISGTPTVANTFVLIYAATDEEGATNSVSFNLTVNPAATTSVTGNFEGYLDKLDCGGIRGWVWDRSKPNTPFTVEFYTETSPGQVTVLGSTLANIYRSDLKDAGKGNGAHAYNFTAPASLANGTLVNARVLGSNYVLKGSPKAYQCANARLAAETAPELEVVIFGNPVRTDAVQFAIQGAANQAVRLLLTNLQGHIVQEKQIPAGEANASHQLSLGGEPAGVLLLRVSTPGRFKTVKIIKAN
ncbi:putative Ig domain-containing protein [Larkinella rosea]|uniref:T9SS C-terminal target domain-containing protein n=1 Tax=Larkinella rosea TaxID=2025312 RepID=A0A3P1BDI4_9BACT|nr:putative Ig domain-containing protein [Larkinella rosea]RRA99169.1 T9SS C-terminal target domain-containing protein [Larkinella rosea]